MLLSKTYDKEVYGEWSLYISVLGLVLTASSLSLMYSSQVLFPKRKGTDLAKDITSVIGFKVIATFVVGCFFLSYMFMTSLFDSQILYSFLFVLIFRTICDLTFGILRALLLVKDQVLFFLIESLLIIAFLVIINNAVPNQNVIISILAFGFAQFISAIYGIYLLKDYFSIKNLDLSRAVPYLKIGLPLIPFAFMDLIINAITPLFIKSSGTLEDVAIFSIAQKVALLITIPSSVLNNIYTQYLSKALMESKQKMLYIFRVFFLLYLISNFVMFALLYAFGRDVIYIISDETYHNSYDVMILLAISNVIVIFSSMMTSIFAVMDRVKQVSIVWVMVLGIYISLSFVLSNFYHVWGAISAILVSFSIGFVLMLWFTYRVIKE